MMLAFAFPDMPSFFFFLSSVNIYTYNLTDHDLGFFVLNTGAHFTKKKKLRSETSSCACRTGKKTNNF